MAYTKDQNYTHKVHTAGGTEITKGNIFDPKIHVPAVMECPKCKFRLVSTYMNARTGNLSPNTSGDQVCPNDGTLLSFVTWEQEAKDAINLHSEFFEKYESLKKFNDALIVSIDTTIDFLKKIDRPLIRQEKFSKLRLEARELAEKLKMEQTNRNKDLN